jgi:hypothetical protein
MQVARCAANDKRVAWQTARELCGDACTGYPNMSGKQAQKGRCAILLSIAYNCQDKSVGVAGIGQRGATNIGAAIRRLTSHWEEQTGRERRPAIGPDTKKTARKELEHSSC